MTKLVFTNLSTTFLRQQTHGFIRSEWCAWNFSLRLSAINIIGSHSSAPEQIIATAGWKFMANVLILNCLKHCPRTRAIPPNSQSTQAHFVNLSLRVYAVILSYALVHTSSSPSFYYPLTLQLTHEWWAAHQHEIPLLTSGSIAC